MPPVGVICALAGAAIHTWRCLNVGLTGTHIWDHPQCPANAGSGAVPPAECTGLAAHLLNGGKTFRPVGGGFITAHSG